MKKNFVSDFYWGIVFVVFGGLLLAGNLDYIDFELTPHFMKTYWPVILILVGGSIVVKSLMRARQKNGNRED